MATKGMVVLGVVLGFIFLIIFIVLLATSAGGPGPLGSAGNWTATQVAEQTTAYKERVLSDLGLDQAFVDMLSDCYTKAMATVYTYDYAKLCNTKDSKCEPTEADIRAMSSCFGGVKRGSWSPELKKIMEAAAPKNSPPEMLRAWPCIIQYLSLNYDLIGAMAALKNATPGDSLTQAILACVGIRA
jgi:hypothetical protein